MNPGRYTIKSFFTFQNLEQLLIPEIQRDYVWQIDNITKLLQSIVDDSKSKAKTDTSITEDFLKSLAPDVREMLVRSLEEKKVFSNIGFIYAYYDAEQITKYMLIDGQQRLTSVFLILLALYIKEKKQDQFKKIYFVDDKPKVDYKVRENAHIFLIDLIKFLLNSGDIIHVREQYWFYSSYKNDPTITAIVDNYAEIESILSKNALTVDYVENNVEFWYFDTAKSEQGEDLYLYMNSRGESVQTNENIKAELLESKSEAKKNEWGKRWEDWQNTFWLNRGDYASADRGFDEFLRWIKIIELIKENNWSKNIDLSKNIREIRDSQKFSKDGLTLERIESYYNALQLLLDADLGRYFAKDFLEEQPDVIEYVRILPLLAYAEKLSAATKKEFTRFARFFFNITRFDDVSKNPYPYIGQVIQLTDNFLDKGHTDVTDLTIFKEPGLYDNFLTGEEMKKLLLYSDPGSEFTREELEELFWDAEDFALCDGRISILWHCMDYDPFLKNKDHFNKNLFNSYFDTFKLLFRSPDDLLRRALLTKGDYALKDGNSNVLEATRWSYGLGTKNWRDILNSDGRDDILKLLLSDYNSRFDKSPQSQSRKILEDIISDYLAKDKDTSWYHYFVADFRILQYCKNKLVCFQDETIEGIYLLEGKLAVNDGYKALAKFVKK